MTPEEKIRILIGSMDDWDIIALLAWAQAQMEIILRTMSPEELDTEFEQLGTRET